MIDKNTIKEYFLTSVGSFMAAFSVYYFMVPENLATGGVSGLAIVLTGYLPLPISLISLILNIVLLIVGFIFIGWEFGGKTIFSVILLSVFMSIMENVYPSTNPITDNTLLNLICGIIISAMGLSIVFNQNASTGGTDILAKILNKYFNLDIGTGLMTADVFVVACSFFTYGLNTGIMGAFGWFLNGIVINYFIDGLNVKREVVIITNKPTEIKDYIFKEIARGVTIYKAEGGYHRDPKDIIVTVLAKNEYFKLKKELPKIDNEVFMLTRTVHEVLGQGFSKF